MESNNKVYIEADLVIHEETATLREQASKAIKLPDKDDKQPDLMYFSAIFVSSGENLNHAYFMGSELLSAEGTIVNKALDLEHVESEIIGHLYDRAYITKDGEPIDIEEASNQEKANIDATDMHIAVAGIIYKNRFPEIAMAVASNKYKVSMECYYQNYDVKIGDVIMSRVEAESLGMASVNDCIGKSAKVIKDGKEIASGNVARVLRNICFSGCGIVKNPANPPSVILEVASTEDQIVINLDNKVTHDNLDSNKETATDGNMDDTVGICVYFKKFTQDQSKNNWCSCYDSECTSFSREATDTECMMNLVVMEKARRLFEIANKKMQKNDRRKKLLDKLSSVMKASKKLK